MSADYADGSDGTLIMIIEKQQINSQLSERSGDPASAGSNTQLSERSGDPASAGSNSQLSKLSKLSKLSSLFSLITV